MTGKKTPPKKVSKAELKDEHKKELESNAADIEKETGLAAVLRVKVKETGEEFDVSREYYLKNKASVELVKDDA